MNRKEVIELVYGTPDVWTVRPTTFAEIDPVIEMSRVYDHDYAEVDPTLVQPKQHSCHFCKETVQITHAEYKRHMYLQHGMGDGADKEQCRGWNRCGGLNV